MNELSVISDVTTIASNFSTMWTTMESRYDTRTLRKTGNKLVYSLQTLSNGKQLMDCMGFEGRNLQRAEALMDAFTVVARDEIMKTLR